MATFIENFDGLVMWREFQLTPYMPVERYTNLPKLFPSYTSA